MKTTVMLRFVPAVFLFGVCAAQGKIFVGENFSLPASESIKEELFLVAEKAEISGRLDNEFIGLARSVVLNGFIKRDVICASLNSELSADIGADLYLVADTVRASGRVAGSATVFGKEVHCSNLSVGGGLRAGASRLVCRAAVAGKTVLWGNDIKVEGQYHDLTVYGQKIALAGGTQIAGDFVYRSNEPLVIPPEVSITGQVRWEKPVSDRLQKKFFQPRLKKLFSFFSLFIPFLLMQIFTPNLLAQTALSVGRNPLRCFIMGVALMVFSAIIILLVFLTIFGAWFGVIIGTSFISLLYLARAFPAVWLGRKILFKLPDSTGIWILTLLLGIFIFVFFGSLPRVGIIINLLCLPLGFGALITGRLRFFKKLREEKIL